MHRGACVRDYDTPLVCARGHRQMTMNCAYSSAALLVQRTVGTWLGITRGLHGG